MEVETLLQTHLLYAHSDTKMEFLSILDCNQALDKANNSNMMQTPVFLRMRLEMEIRSTIMLNIRKGENGSNVKRLVT